MTRVRTIQSEPWLRVGGWFSLVAAAIHLAAIAGGPAWYRFFGAGEPIARAAERGSPVPAIMTLCIAAVLGLAAAFAFSGTGAIRRLPLVKPALLVISAVYLARGAALFYPPMLGRADLTLSFILWSSAISLAAGLVHAIGTARVWRRL